MLDGYTPREEMIAMLEKLLAEAKAEAEAKKAKKD